MRELLYRNPRLVVALNAFLTALILIFILLILRDVFSSAGKKREVPAEQTGRTAQKAKKALRDYEDILRNNPFGVPPGQLKQLSVVAEGGQSHTDVTLIGTISGVSSRSYAIFSDRTGHQEVFRVGESVFGTGKLARVDKDRVFISSNGREIKIPLAEMLTIRDVSAVDAARPTSEFARSTGSGTYIVDQKKIQYALENPNQLMTDARLQPNIVNGKQEGFVLREVRQGGIYQSLGLQNGDVLLRINDYAISNPENALQAFTALRGLDRVQVDLVRGGSRTTLTYQIR